MFLWSAMILAVVLAFSCAHSYVCSPRSLEQQQVVHSSKNVGT